MKRTFCTVTFFLFTLISYSQDTTPPELTGLSFSPSSIDIDDNDPTITVSISATDALNEIKSISVRFSNDDGSGSGLVSFNNIRSNEFSGSGSFTLRSSSEPGNWSVKVSLEDTKKNKISYSATELESMGFPSSLLVTQTIIKDETPPVLTGFSLSPGSIELPGTAIINFSVSADDDDSGIDAISVRVSGGQGGSKSERIRDINSTSANVSGSIDLGNNPSPGTWSASVSISDKEGNQVSYSSSDLEGMGYSSSFEVLEINDETPPSLLDFSFSPQLLDIEGINSIVEVSISSEDLESGLDNIVIDFDPVENGSGKSIRFTKIESNTAELSDEIDFKNAKPGVYLISIVIEDAERNSISFSSEDLDRLGIPSMLTVISGKDTTAPVLSFFTLSADTVDINSLQNTIEYSLHVEDNGSEIKNININFNPPGNGSGESIKFNSVRDSVLESSGSVEFKKNSTEGLWTIDIETEDEEKNKGVYSSELLEELGFSYSIYVKATTDTLPPVLTGLSITPESVDVNDSLATITFSISASDDLSGIDQIDISFGNKKERFNKIDSTNFSYSSSFELKQNEKSGELEISISMKDNDKNSISLSSEELEQMGFPSKIVITDEYFLELLYPTGSETIISGEDIPIEWNFGGVKKVKLSYSTDSGNSWNSISGNITASRKNYNWKTSFTENSEILIQLTDDGNENISDVSGCFISVSALTDLFDSEELPNETKLYQNYPNPFNPTTEINYTLKESGSVVISIFNSLGEKISEPVNEWKNAGKHFIKFNAQGLPSGTYFYILSTENYYQSGKMLLLK